MVDNYYKNEFEKLTEELTELHRIAIKHLENNEIDLYLTKIKEHNNKSSLLNTYFKNMMKEI